MRQNHHLVDWTNLAGLDGFETWHERPAAVLIDRDLYAVEDADLAAKVIEAPWEWLPLTTVTEEERDELLEMPEHEWPEDDHDTL